ncbi:MAG: hypothetical protein ACQEXJ_02170 [Myxococcota bacterium]
MFGPRTFAIALAAVAVSVASAPTHAAGTEATRTAAEQQAGVSFDQATMLARIDSAFASGALTFEEARALYREQAAIRGAWIEARASGDRRAMERVRYMLRTSQSTLARLTYNDTRRVDIPLHRLLAAAD